MKRLLFLMLFLLPAAQAAERTVAELGAEFWFMPRHGDQIAERPDLDAAVAQLQAEPEAYLVLHYPQTESGELWGQELQAWLVSLGVVSDRIELQSDAEQLDSVSVVLVTPKGETEDNQSLQIDAEPDAADEPATDERTAPAADEALPATSMPETAPAAAGADTDQPQTEQQPPEQQSKDPQPADPQPQDQQQTEAPSKAETATESAAPETQQPAATSGEQAVDVQVETEKQ
jgi:hypothetical protein